MPNCHSHQIMDDFTDDDIESESSYSQSPFLRRCISKRDMARALANRVIHSTFYKAFYALMTLMAITAIIIPIFYHCMTVWYLIFEFIITAAFFLETLMRFLAMQRNFFRIPANCLDVLLLTATLVLLFLIFRDCCTCSKNNEVWIDSFLLIFRNIIQLFRVFVMIKRYYNSNLETKTD